MERHVFPSWLLTKKETPERLVHPKGNRPRAPSKDKALKYRVTCLVNRGWSVERIALHLGYTPAYVEGLIKCVAS